jgi:hypothetical protein
MSVCVQFRTTWSGQSRVAAISSELSARDEMPQNDLFILCEWHRHDPLQLDVATMTRGIARFHTAGAVNRMTDT